MTQVVPNYVSALYALSQMYSLNFFYQNLMQQAQEVNEYNRNR